MVLQATCSNIDDHNGLIAPAVRNVIFIGKRLIEIGTDTLMAGISDEAASRFLEPRPSVGYYGDGVCHAYAAARSARFEFGETPAPPEMSTADRTQARIRRAARKRGA
jgi:hypothetical protein